MECTFKEVYCNDLQNAHVKQRTVWIPLGFCFSLRVPLPLMSFLTPHDQIRGRYVALFFFKLTKIKGTCPGSPSAPVALQKISPPKKEGVSIFFYFTHFKMVSTIGHRGL